MKICSINHYLQLFFFAAGLFVFNGCASSSAHKQIDYYDVLESWTVKADAYVDLELRLLLESTYKSPEFRQAFVDEYATRYSLDSDAKAALARSSREAGSGVMEFFLSVYTAEIDWNDFDKKESIWKIYLEDASGARVEPLEIKKLDKNDARVEEFYSYVRPWSLVYSITFPTYAPSGGAIGEGGGHIKLIVTGAKGRGELLWNLSSGETSQSSN